MKKQIATCVLLAATLPTLAFAGNSANSTLAADMEWIELGPGLSMTQLWQDQDTKDTGLLLKFAPGFKGISHGHSNAYHGVTLQGTWVHVDSDGTRHDLPAGSVAFQPAHDLHSDECISEEECIVLFHLDAEYDFFLPE